MLDCKQSTSGPKYSSIHSRWVPHNSELSPNRCTIKSILNEIQKDADHYEKYSYALAQSSFNESMKKGSTFAQNKDLSRELGGKQKGDNLYLYYSNIGRTMAERASPKDKHAEGSKLLKGVFTPKFDGGGLQFAKTRSMVDLRKAGNAIVGGKPDSKQTMKQLDSILNSRKAKRQFQRSSMGTLPAASSTATPVLHTDFSMKHYPTRRLEQNKIMFNEIFVQPILDQLKLGASKDQEERKRLKLPNIAELRTQRTPEQPDNAHSDHVRETLVKERQDKLREANKHERSLDISSLIERRRFNRNTDNLFGDDEEEAFKTIEKADLDELKDEDLKLMQDKAADPNRPQYEFHNYFIRMVEDRDDEENNDIVRVIMRRLNSKAKRKSAGSFFTQQIQVQPPEGLINMIGSEGSWAPSVPLTNTSMSKTKGKERSLNDTSLQDIRMRAKAGVQAGDVKKEAHMAFCLGSLNEDKNVNKSIRYYKRFFFCARILEDPVGAALALNRLGVAYHKVKNHEKSLMFHLKHKEYTDKENLFAAYYNLGISQRLLKKYDESVQSFTKALEWASTHQELDSECFCNGQLGITELIRGSPEVASKHLNICLDFAKMLKNTRLQLDCLL